MKVTYLHQYFLLSLLILFSTAEWSNSAIINIPEDTPTLHEGIHQASDGDTIQVNQHDVLIQHIRIINKDLTIIGTLPNEKARVLGIRSSTILEPFNIDIPPTSNFNVLTVENSAVVFENLEFLSAEVTAHQVGVSYSMTAPWQVISGRLVFKDVIFHGLIKVFSDIEIHNSIIYGDSYYFEYYSYKSRPTKRAFPAIHIRQQESPEIKIYNSQFLCNIDRGSRAIVIEKINNGNIEIINSSIYSGTSNIGQSLTVPGSYLDATDDVKGLAGVLIVNSTNVKLTMTDSISKGSDGHPINYTTLSPSGPGIEILNSYNIDIFNGTSLGHEGHNGFITHRMPDMSIYEDLYIHGGDGGNGLFVTNSTVYLYNHQTIGGKGGEGDPPKDVLPGQDGQPIYQDENSQIIYGTSIPDWMLHTN